MNENMNEKIKGFLMKIEEDKDLQAKLSQVRDPDEAYKLVRGLLDGLTKEEFIAEMTKLYESQLQDLSEEDIAKIAGGASVGETILVSASVASTIAGYAAAAAVF